MKTLELNKEYEYKYLVKLADDKYDYQIYGPRDYDEPMIGTSFLAFIHLDREEVYSFVMSGYTMQSIWKLIYKWPE